MTMMPEPNASVQGQGVGEAVRRPYPPPPNPRIASSMGLRVWREVAPGCQAISRAMPRIKPASASPTRIRIFRRCRELMRLALWRRSKVGRIPGAFEAPAKNVPGPIAFFFVV